MLMQFDEAITDHQNHKPKKKRRLPRKWLLILATIFLASGGMGAGWYYLKDGSRSPLPEEVIQKSESGVYYPSKLPENFILEKSSAKVSAGVTTYTLNDTSSGKTIIVNSQRTPHNFNVNRFSDSIRQTFNIPLGAAYDISSDQRSGYFILTPYDDLIIISSASRINGAIIRSLLLNLEKI